MQRGEITSRTQNLLKSKLGDEALEVNESTKFIGNCKDSLAMSSLDYVEFMVSVEEEFNIVFDFNSRINSINQVVDYVCSEKPNEE